MHRLRELERIVSTQIIVAMQSCVAQSIERQYETQGAFAVRHPGRSIVTWCFRWRDREIGDGVGTWLAIENIERAARRAVWIESGYEATEPLSATAVLSLVRA